MDICGQPDLDFDGRRARVVCPDIPGIGYTRRLQDDFAYTEARVRRFREAVRCEVELNGGTDTLKAMHLRIAQAHAAARVRQCALELRISFPQCACLNC